jgi:hypothetical protein
MTRFRRPLARVRLATVGWLLLTAGVVCAAPPPALVVVIALDQFRADYLEKFRPQFGPGGFRLLLEQGADFTDCHYRHSLTKTAPGHSVMLTGVHANLHGIIGNDWIDRESLERVSCVGDTTVQIVGLPPPTGPHLPGILDPYLGRSPRNLLVTTVGDEWKLARGNRPKVIGISNKDRAAILMSGHLADAAYFMENGRMVSSTYYMKELPAWVSAFNASGRADSYFGRVWDRVLPAAAYDAQGPDDAPGEFDGLGLGRTLPKTITGGETKPGQKFYDTLFHTPFASELLADFARAAIENENLGHHGVTDILCMSFSATDYIGHDYGPDSHEVMDNIVRTDCILATFLKFLDDRLGLKNCTIVLTADHGTPPLPERLKAIDPRFDAGRVDNARVLAVAEAALVRAFGPLAGSRHWIVPDGYSLLFGHGALAEKKIDAAAAEAVVRDALLTIDFVQAAYTAEDLKRGQFTDDLGRRAVLSYNAARSGDVFYQTKPYWLDRDKTGTNHGSPYNYDTHVPLLWLGVGVTPGVRTERVGVDDLAPTLAHILGLPAPPFSAGRVLFPQ